MIRGVVRDVGTSGVRPGGGRITRGIAKIYTADSRVYTVATPAANLMAREFGFSRVLFCAAVLYGIALLTFPTARKRTAWNTEPARSPAAE